MTALNKPRAVQGGDAIVVSPASTPQGARIDAAFVALRDAGFQPQDAGGMLARGPLYFAGLPEERLRDLHHAFATDAGVIFATRGGYGSNYLLDDVDYRAIAQSPKPMFGYSDLTALQLAILDRAEVPAFHGPMLSADWAREDGVDFASLRAALSGELYSVGAAEGLRVLRPGFGVGTVRGVLYGGCLSTLVSLIGTPFEPALEGRLLFLEDVNEKPYQIDRMLWQLRRAGKLEGTRGIVFGEMLDCVSPGARPEFLDEVLMETLKDFRGPIAIGLRSGHVSRANVTLTFGVEAELVVTENEAALHMREAAVQA